MTPGRSTDAPILRQYTAVAIGGRAVLVKGKPGVGKTALALCLIDRGAELIGDDGVALMVKPDGLWAAPPTATQGKIELRNIGIAELPCVSAPVGLTLRIVENAPRFVEEAEWMSILDHPVPHLDISIGPAGPTLADAIRVEYALTLHGLRHEPATFV
ncbi:MAG: HPr kinase/phosphatase C-terminal domain-containing protein [Pontixanthobacter sp.]